ncbi:MAG TPA: class I tRNA ligase family protein, partial [Tepidisphaeraceae bacterium]|nr:class I tRNA ligase family protein [Tepidisphaeraceae bacterium]
QDVQDKSVYVEFPLKNAAEPTFLLVWTTTPWTLPANLAVAVHPEVEYVKVRYSRNGQARVGIIARELATKVFEKSKLPPEILETKKGSDLAGMEYRHPFIDRVGKVVLAEYVTTTDGTGLVHTAPGHGEDDYETGLREKLDVYSPVMANGRFDDTVPEWLRGKTVKESNELITQNLKDAGLLFAEETITHSYPHDWRSKTPIIFRATEQWFVSMDKPFSGGPGGPRSLRDRAMDAISKTDFVPPWGRARLEGMLQSRPDWCISRQRAWGLPIPVFYNEKGEALLSPESVRAVAKHIEEKGSDVWFTDTPMELLGCDQTVCPAHFGDVAKLRKEKDIFDVWFESGSSWHAVLQMRSYLQFPADLYLEGSDQHRGWFQLSMLPSLGVNGAPPFKQVLTHGFVVKPDGTKVSKSDKEYVTATQEVQRHGADVLRLWVCSVDYQNDIPTSPAAIKEFGDKYRKIRNTLRYLLSNLYDFDPAKNSQQVLLNSLDGWANAQLDELIREVTTAYDAYQLHRAFRLLHDFCSVQISAIYGNAMKDRLYCESPDSKLRRRSHTVMHRMLVVLTKLLAPMLVFTMDELWEHIAHKPLDEASLASVHLALLPEASNVQISDAQREEWKLLMDLRDQALGQIDKLTRQIGKYKALDAEVIYHVDDDELRRKLQAYGADLEDMVGAGFNSFAEKSPEGKTVVVEVVDRRDIYASCARSWKRRPDVGSDVEYPDLSLRDAAAVKARKSE